MKTLAILTMFAAGATLYVHIRHHDPQPFFHFSRSEVPATPAPRGEIVIAPFKGGTLEERWKDPAWTPSPRR